MCEESTDNIINKGIVENYIKQIKYRSESDAIIKFIYENFCVSNSLDWLEVSLKSFKKWKLMKAVEELKSKGYLMACAIDCDKVNNKKDSWRLTNRGTRLAKALFGDDVQKAIPSAKSSQICCRNRSIAKMMFSDLDKKAEFIDGDFLTRCLENDKGLPFRGSVIAGYLLANETNYLVYSLTHSNIPIFESRDKRSLKQVEALLQIKSKKSVVGSNFNRIIIVKDSYIVRNIFNTTKNARWFIKDGKARSKQYDRALFYPDEGIMRGEAYVLNCSIEQKDTIKDLYCNPSTTLLTTDNILKQVVAMQPELLGTALKEKKYPISVEETNKYVVFNLITQELHRMSFINKLLEEKEEKRKVLIYTTGKQDEFIKSCYKDYEGRIVTIALDEKEVAKQVKCMKEKRR